MREFACDGIILDKERKRTVVIKRGVDPCKGEWAIPGGRIERDEDAEHCLIREMKEETNLVVRPIKFTGIYSDPNRDPRGVIVAAYLCEVVSGELKGGDDAQDAYWAEVDKLPKLCLDHKKIVEDALKQL